MMRNTYNKICYLLAVAGIKEDEIFDFISYLKSSNASELARDVSFARKNISAPFQNTQRDFLSSERGDKNFRSEVEERVLKLLVIDTGLTKGMAAELLTEKIRERYPSVEISNVAKRSITEWLKTVQRQIPPSELLHLATIIRNQYVHESNFDWALKPNDK